MEDELYLRQELEAFAKRYSDHLGTAAVVTDGVVLLVKTLLWSAERSRHKLIDLGRCIDRVYRGER